MPGMAMLSHQIQDRAATLPVLTGCKNKVCPYCMMSPAVCSAGVGWWGWQEYSGCKEVPGRLFCRQAWWGSSLLSDCVTEFSWILEHISIYLEMVSEWGAGGLNDRDSGGRYSQRNATEAIPQDFTV